MASGKQSSNVKSSSNKAIGALQPVSYSDPWGSFSNGVFTPKLSQTQRDTEGIQDQKLKELSSNLPTQMDVNSYYNNPFYDLTKRMYGRVIEQQRERSTRELDDSLNARNQIGGSYDALMRRYQDQDYQTQLGQAEDQARAASATAYQQAYNNILAGLQGIDSSRGAAMDRAYTPMRMALGYQSAVSPLQQAQAGVYNNLSSYYASRPSLFQNIMSGMDATGRLIGNVSNAIRLFKPPTPTVGI